MRTATLEADFHTKASVQCQVHLERSNSTNRSHVWPGSRVYCRKPFSPHCGRGRTCPDTHINGTDIDHFDDGGPDVSALFPVTETALAQLPARRRKTANIGNTPADS